MKPLAIDLDALTWDAMELMEQAEEQITATGKVRFGTMKRLLPALDPTWTAADAGQIKVKETGQVMDQIRAAMAAAVPPTSGEH